MAEFASENSDMDNLPTPPRIVSNDAADSNKQTAQVYMDSRGSPHSIDLEAPHNEHAVTPAKSLRTAGQGRSSSPRPISNSPSEYLLKTTKARVSDGEALSERRRSFVVGVSETPKPASKKAVPTPPSERLLKTTEARVSDVRAWHATKGVIKHEEDIWWEQRKPLENASKINLKVESRLYEPTTSHIYSQRKKHPHRTTPDKNAVPGSAEKSPATGGRTGSPLKVRTIDAESPLLRTTINATVKNVKNTSVPPPPPALEIHTHSSGPQNVASRLFAPTTSTRAAKWKSREDLAAEEAALAVKSAPIKKIKTPSAHLISYNSAMMASARGKVEKPEGDRREMGWCASFKKDVIPSVEEVPPLPGQRLGSSPLRRRSDGGNSRGDYHSSLNSSLESMDQHLSKTESSHAFNEEMDLPPSPPKHLNGHVQVNNSENGHAEHHEQQSEPMEGVQEEEQQPADGGAAEEEFESY